MADNFGLKIGIEGEKEFKKALADINQSFKVLGSEMKLVDSQFGANDKSIQALSSRNSVLNKEIEAQKGKIETLRSALSNASESFGEADRRTQNWQIKLNQAQAELNKMEREVKENEQSMSRMSAEQSKASDATGRLTQKISEQEDELKDLQRAYSNAVLEYGKNSNEAKELQTRINNLSGELDKNKNALKDASAAMDDAGETAEKTGDRFSKFASVAKGLGAALAASVAAVGAAIGVAAKEINGCIDVYAGFEDSMLQVAATMGITADEIENGSESYEKLTNAAKEAGASTRYSASEAGAALNYLALAGYDADKAVETLPKVLNLAAAGGMELATTSDLVTDAMSALNMETSELDGFIDQLAKTSQKSNTSVQQLGEAILVCAGTANSTGQELTSVNTALGILADNGIKGAEGGTKLRNILLSLSAPTDTAAVALDALGVSAYDSEGNMRQLDEVMLDLNAALGELSQEKRTNAIKNIFNKTDIGAVNALLMGVSGSFVTVNDALAASSIEWEKYEDAAWYAADSVNGLTQDIARSLNELGMSTEELQQHLQLEYGLDAEDALAAIESVKNSLETTAGVVDKISESLEQSSVDWDKYADCAWRVKGSFEGMTRDVIYSITKLGESTEEIQSYLQLEYDLNADDALAVIETVNASLEENGTRWEELSGLIEDSTGAAEEMAGTMEAGLAGTTRSFNSAVEGMQIEIGSIFADFKQTLMSDSIDIIRTFTQNLQAAGGDWGKIGEAIGQALGDIINLVNDYLPKIVDMGLQVIQTLGSALMNNLDILIGTVTSILITLLDTVISWLPSVVEAASQIVVSLATGIGEASPELVPAIVEAVTVIVQTLADNLPMILDAALQLILGLAQGLLNAIPVLIDALPAIITSLVDFLLDAVPQIIDAGIQLLTSLVTALPEIVEAIVEAVPLIIMGLVTAFMEGTPEIIDAGILLLTSLVEALPDIITNILTAVPQIVNGLVATFVDNTPQLVAAGVKLLSALIDGLPRSITTILQAVPKIISGLVSAFNERRKTIVDIGSNIVKGLWQGIQELAGWLWDKVSGWISSIWDGICDFFGIHSPSREMAWIGEMLVKGLSGSIDDNGDQAVSAAEEMVSGVLGAFNDLAEDMNSALPSDFDFEVNTDSAVSAAKKMAEDINGIFNSIEADMVSTMPPSMSINTGSLNADMPQMSGNTGPLFTVQQMVVRSEDDIRRVSQDLYDMIQTGSRAQGRFAIT